jgi:Tfp pilus assembly protein PilO
MTRLHWIAVGGLIGGLVLVFVLGWQFLLRPLGAEHTAKLVEHEQLVKQLEHTKAQAAQFEKFKAQAENVRRDLDFYSRRLDQDLAATELYTIVEGLGRRLGIQDWSYTAKERAKTKVPGLTLDEIEVVARFGGDFERFGQLINSMVEETRLIVPEFFALNRRTGGTETYVDTLAGDITFRIFISPQEAKP